MALLGGFGLRAVIAPTIFAVQVNSKHRKPSADPKCRSTLGLENLHHRSIGVQSWGFGSTLLILHGHRTTHSTTQAIHQALPNIKDQTRLNSGPSGAYLGLVLSGVCTAGGSIGPFNKDQFSQK